MGNRPPTPSGGGGLLSVGGFVVVRHGVDLNDNGVYDEEAAGPSGLDASLPQEATIPANCGVIESVSG